MIAGFFLAIAELLSVFKISSQTVSVASKNNTCRTDVGFPERFESQKTILA